ncbi:DUF2280 domain-containing protein [Sinorhizobium meliloti]|uniref:DUF2280 domain-containing protein n=1 Tax=Rhizobium meliloti TaxID=382 RepID=UPI00399B8598
MAAAVKKEFGVDVSHDPNKKAASGLAPKWKALFGETRKTFLEDTATIAISHRAAPSSAGPRCMSETRAVFGIRARSSIRPSAHRPRSMYCNGASRQELRYRLLTSSMTRPS